MEIPAEMAKVLNYINDGKIWLYVVLFIIVSYLLVSLLTWSFIKPLKYLGIPTLLAGILLIVLRFIPGLFTSLLDQNLDVIKAVLPNLLKPLFASGISCLIGGIIMIALYIVIKKMKKKTSKKINKEPIEEKTEQEKSI